MDRTTDTNSTFTALGLPAPLVAALIANRITLPFPVQTATLPASLAGRDVLGRERADSGNSLAFGLSLLARTAGHRAEARRPLALVLAPTRDLADQLASELAPYARSLELRLATAVGGASSRRQAATLREGVEIVIATPQRMSDLVQRGDCQLDAVRVVVLDGADRMADLGLLPRVNSLLDAVGPDAQRMLFSAALDHGVDELVRRYLRAPVEYTPAPLPGGSPPVHPVRGPAPDADADAAAGAAHRPPTGRAA